MPFSPPSKVAVFLREMVSIVWRSVVNLGYLQPYYNLILLKLQLVEVEVSVYKPDALTESLMTSDDPFTTSMELQERSDNNLKC